MAVPEVVVKVLCLQGLLGELSYGQEVILVHCDSQCDSLG